MYPRSDTQEFNHDHYFAVHCPMGVGSLWRRYGVKPSRMFFHTHSYGQDRTPGSAAFTMIATMLFERKKDADRFIDLFDDAEARAMLEADFPFFTGEPAIGVVSEFIERDPGEFIAEADRVLGPETERASTE